MTDNAPAKPDPAQTPPGKPPGGCPPLTAPEPPDVCAEPRDCPTTCDCPSVPTEPPGCFDEAITKNRKLVTEAERAKKFADDLQASKDKLKSALVTYTNDRYEALKKLWGEQDELIGDLTKTIDCSVPCWECLLECRLCSEIVAIRDFEDRLNGTGELTTKIFSLYDLQYWHQRNVAQLQARLDRITKVLAAWEKPSETLGEVLDKNGKLIEDTEKTITTDPGKALFDIFMTLIPRHLAIRPTGVETVIDEKFIEICKCDDGEPDTCCGPDTGIVTLRDRLVGPLPNIVDPTQFTNIVCCLVTERLTPASEQLAKAQADLAAATDDIERIKKSIEDRTAGLEATFTADLGNPICCNKYKKKEPAPTPTPDGGYQKPTNHTAR